MADRRRSGFVVADGFLRSVGPASSGAAPISLIAEDRRDLDAGRPRLMTLLESGDVEDPALLAEAARLLQFKRAEGLSRVNWAAPYAGDLGDRGARRRILVVDRPAELNWLDGPPAPVAAYGEMIAAARRDHPDALVLVWREPGGGALSEAELALADIVLPGDVDVIHLIESVDEVYAVTGLLGLEAVLCGRPVKCFGAPFYAGWGLTEDLGPVVTRPRPLGREALFAAAYLLYPRYIDPLTGQSCDPATAFERLATFKRHAARVAGHWIGLNLPLAKHGVLRAFLSGPRSSFTPQGRPREDASLLAWSSWPSDAVARARRAHPDQVVNVEDGFLRSVGLGSSFVPASSLAMDRRGIYYDPSRRSDLEHLLNETAFDHDLLERARVLRRAIVQTGVSKYNLRDGPGLDIAAAGGRLKILVPGQVENDASVIHGGGLMTNAALLTRVRAAHPDAFILYKQHPDVTAGNRIGRIEPALLRRLSDQVVTRGDVIACIDAVDEVHTLTSLTGFEALLRGKPVTTHGWPFYAGWGLTEDRAETAGPARRALTLDALVAGALILYPLYLDPVTWLPCDALTFVERLGQQRAMLEAKQSVTQAGRMGRVMVALKAILNPPRPPAY